MNGSLAGVDPTAVSDDKTGEANAGLRVRPPMLLAGSAATNSVVSIITIVIIAATTMSENRPPLLYLFTKEKPP